MRCENKAVVRRTRAFTALDCKVHRRLVPMINQWTRGIKTSSRTKLRKCHQTDEASRTPKPPGEQCARRTVSETHTLSSGRSDRNNQRGGSASRLLRRHVSAELHRCVADFFAASAEGECCNNRGENNSALHSLSPFAPEKGSSTRQRATWVDAGTSAPSFIGAWCSSRRHAETATAAISVAMTSVVFTVFIWYVS